MNNIKESKKVPGLTGRKALLPVGAMGLLVVLAIIGCFVTVKSILQTEQSSNVERAQIEDDKRMAEEFGHIKKSESKPVPDETEETESLEEDSSYEKLYEMHPEKVPKKVPETSKPTPEEGPGSPKKDYGKDPSLAPQSDKFTPNDDSGPGPSSCCGCSCSCCKSSTQPPD